MGIDITYEILLSLQEMFGNKGRLARQVALRSIMIMKRTKGTPIRDHMIHMIVLFNEMEILGAEI